MPFKKIKKAIKKVKSIYSEGETSLNYKAYQGRRASQIKKMNKEVDKRVKKLSKMRPKRRRKNIQRKLKQYLSTGKK